jgi:cellobiose phosphorylase
MMNSSEVNNWKFIDGQGSFEFEKAVEGSYLYLPLINQAGMVSSVTPNFNGDAKADQNSFLLLPTSVEDLHNSRAARNFWVLVEGKAWSATGGSAEQTARHFSKKQEPVTFKAGMLWQTVSRTHKTSGLKAEVTSFVPMRQDRVELMRVILTNSGKKELKLIPTAAMPIFGRSADNLRDHRHVTSLLHRTICVKHGVVVQPTLSFDERGHTHNQLRYAVLGSAGDGSAPIGFFPLTEDFIGEGGSLDWPQAVIENLPPSQGVGKSPDGYETVGALRFAEATLQPGESISYVIVLAILNSEQKVDALVKNYANVVKFEKLLSETKEFWKQKSSLLEFKTGDDRFDGWLKWVGIQPILRRWIGNSFLPYHDYGRGGRGWRDLWQDALALLLTEPEEVAGMLHDNFAGVRLDGSNATIIGSKPGEFKADRNNIPRVWMDHGAWPLLTVAQYIDLTGDLDFLLREQVYFKDRLSHRSKKVDTQWKTGSDTRLTTETGKLVQGTLLEHMLVQHLTVFYNVGEHNIMKLEGADWNDALDMAAEKGESVAFSGLYAANLHTLSSLCLALEKKGIHQVELAEELNDLIKVPVKDYVSVEAKNKRLQSYFDRVAHTVSGKKIMLSLTDLAKNLAEKADSLTEHIRKQEWVTDKKGHGWFNGYYDNLGKQVDGEHDDGTHMTLTGQVFALMGGIATDEQATSVVKASDHYLYDKQVDGYRLNTYFGEGTQHLGRAFGFGFGHKENGAMFSHMAVMYSNALYKHGLTKQGWKVLWGMYRQSQDFSRSHMYPGLPEYFNNRGRGMYPFLTGSASWYLLTLLTEVYGVKGRLGDLALVPRLAGELGDSACVNIQFAGKTLEIEYYNPQGLSGAACLIKKVEVNGKVHESSAVEVVFARNEIAGWPKKSKISVALGR